MRVGQQSSRVQGNSAKPTAGVGASHQPPWATLAPSHTHTRPWACTLLCTTMPRHALTPSCAYMHAHTPSQVHTHSCAHTQVCTPSHVHSPMHTHVCTCSITGVHAALMHTHECTPRTSAYTHPLSPGLSLSFVTDFQRGESSQPLSRDARAPGADCHSLLLQPQDCLPGGNVGPGREGTPCPWC